MTPDHKAAASWAEQIPKQATVSMDDENLSRAYLDLVAREQRAVELLREVCVQYECTDFNVTSDLYEKARAFLAERGEV